MRYQTGESGERESLRGDNLKVVWAEFSTLSLAVFVQVQWKGINCKQSTRLKASAFFSLLIFFSCYETQQLILGTGTAIWWVTEPHCITYTSMPTSKVENLDKVLSC